MKERGFVRFNFDHVTHRFAGASSRRIQCYNHIAVNMSERMRELVEEPVSFLNEGIQFLNRCTKPSRKGTCETAKNSFNRIQNSSKFVALWAPVL